MSNDSKDKNLFEKLIAIVRTGRNVVSSYDNTSYTNLTDLTQVAPLCIVSDSIRRLEYYSDLLQTQLTLFSMYYMMAASKLTVIEDAKVAKVLDKLNPNRNDSVIFMSNEERDPDMWQFRLPGTIGTALEDADLKLDNVKDAMTTILEPSNMAVGNVITLKISTGGEKPEIIPIPIQITLDVRHTRMPVITQLLARRANNETFSERKLRLELGEISKVEFLTTIDLIKEETKALMSDKEGLLSEISNRVNKAKMYGALTQSPSAAVSSALYIVSKEDMEEVKQRMSGSINIKKIRDKIFDTSYAMIIAVVDADRDMVSFYFNGMDRVTDIPVKTLKSKASKQGTDIFEMMKLMNLSGQTRL